MVVNTFQSALMWSHPIAQRISRIFLWNFFIMMDENRSLPQYKTIIEIEDYEYYIFHNYNLSTQQLNFRNCYENAFGYEIISFTFEQFLTAKFYFYSPTNYLVLQKEYVHIFFSICEEEWEDFKLNQRARWRARWEGGMTSDNDDDADDDDADDDDADDDDADDGDADDDDADLESDANSLAQKHITAIMNVVDDLKNTIPEGQYLSLCSHLKNLYECIE